MLERFEKKERRRNRIRTKVSGTIKIPRLSVNVSSRHVIAQLIDDVSGNTLAYTDDKGKEFVGGKTKTETARKVGEEIGILAKNKKITKVVFDRGGKLYHGRVKALADGAREQGLDF